MGPGVRSTVQGSGAAQICPVLRGCVELLRHSRVCLPAQYARFQAWARLQLNLPRPCRAWEAERNLCSLAGLPQVYGPASMGCACMQVQTGALLPPPCLHLPAQLPEPWCAHQTQHACARRHGHTGRAHGGVAAVDAGHVDDAPRGAWSGQICPQQRQERLRNTPVRGAKGACQGWPLLGQAVQPGAPAGHGRP